MLVFDQLLKMVEVKVKLIKVHSRRPHACERSFLLR